MGTVAVGIVRKALYDRLTEHTVPGGVLEGVKILPEPPKNPEDLYGQSRKVYDAIFIVNSRSTFGPAAVCGSGVELQETTTHTFVVTTTRMDSTQGTQHQVDDRCGKLLSAVFNIIGGDMKLGLNLADNDFRDLFGATFSAEYDSDVLASGGTNPGHGAAYVVTYEITSASLFDTPALP